MDPDRYLTAQKDTYAAALSELRTGWKRGHWMWFIFPQLAGLGFSSTAQFYAIQSIDEAAAYLAHPVLGPRLIECCEALLLNPERSARTSLAPRTTSSSALPSRYSLKSNPLISCSNKFSQHSTTAAQISGHLNSSLSGIE